ncbi:MAG: DUF3168 domain-containing protein [Comamonadaceae bacterium]|nr:MAG: DUF3168 domain-containing protein [Comamonadaceae bacterium]
MSHPITELQAMLVAALRAEDLPVFDAPPSGTTPPYLAIVRHDVVPRDGDDAPGHEHRVAIHCWANTPSRKAALALAEHVLAVGLGPLSGALAVTLAVHERTETAIDGETGFARAAVVLRFCTEPT